MRFDITGVEALGNDYPWAKEVPVDNLHTFLENPPEWVGTNTQGSPFLNPFTLAITEDDGLASLGNIFISGQKGTNLASLVLRSDSLASYVGYLESLLNLSKKDLQAEGLTGNQPVQQIASIIEAFTSGDLPNKALTGRAPHLDITVYYAGAGRRSRAEMHFTIGGPFSSSRAKMLYISAYILSLTKERDATLRSLEESYSSGNYTLKYVLPNGAPTTVNETISFAPFTSPGSVPITYLGDVNNTQEACEMLVAMYKDGLITAQQAYIKTYA